jgi:phage shock protein A
MATLGRHIGDVAVRALLHRIGAAVSVDVAILLMEADRSGAMGNAQLRQFTADLATIKRALAVMLVDATRLQLRTGQYQAEAAHWQARAERALQAGDAPLARQALVRRLHWQHVAKEYADQQTTQQRALDQVQAAVAHLEARIRAVQPVRELGWGSRRGAANTMAAHDHETVESRFEKFELDQAMDALRRTMQG